MIYVFRPRHILIFGFSVLTIYAWMFGDSLESTEISFLLLVKALSIIVGTLFAVVGWTEIFHSSYKKEIKLPNLFKRSDTFGPEHPSWNDFREFLKEREENEI